MCQLVLVGDLEYMGQLYPKVDGVRYGWASETGHPLAKSLTVAGMFNDPRHPFANSRGEFIGPAGVMNSPLGKPLVEFPDFIRG